MERKSTKKKIGRLEQKENYINEQVARIKRLKEMRKGRVMLVLKPLF